MNTFNMTKNILNKNGICAKKRFGQNFLIDDKVLKNIVDSNNIQSTDNVIEIGPGIGNLTEYILQSGCKVYAFEIDNNMIKILEERFSKEIKENRLTIISDDILQVDLNAFLLSFSEKVKVIANLPYYITTPIIFKLLENIKQIDDITIMVQKELADRVIAKEKSKEYGVLTIMVNMCCDVSKLFDVQANSFMPAPKVTSAVIKLQVDDTKTKKLEIINECLFRKIVKAAFSTRRKTVVNSLYNANILELSKEQIEAILNKVQLNKLVRAEEISLRDYSKICREIMTYIDVSKWE